MAQLGHGLFSSIIETLEKEFITIFGTLGILDGLPRMAWKLVVTNQHLRLEGLLYDRWSGKDNECNQRTNKKSLPAQKMSWLKNAQFSQITIGIFYLDY